MENKIITVKNAEGEADTQAIIIHENNIEYAPKISVIIPVYNTEKYLHQCLNSVVNQTLKEIEIICVDDGSTDSSLEILKEYAQKDNRFTILTQKNLHAGVARNAGLAIAKGEYIHFLDSDDWLKTCSYSNLFDIAKSNNVDFVKFRAFSYNNLTAEITSTSYLDIASIDEKFFNKIIKMPTDINIAVKLPDSPWSGFYNAKFLIDNGISFDNSICANDVVFFYRCVVNAKNIYLYSEKLIYYRENIKTSLIGIRATHFECQTNLYDRVKKIIEDLPYHNKNLILNEVIRSVFLWYNRYQQDSSLSIQTKVYIDNEIKNFIKKISSENLSYENLVNFKRVTFEQQLNFTSKYFSICHKLSKNDKWYTSIKLFGLKINIRTKNFDIFSKNNLIKNFTTSISVIIPVYNVEKYLSKCLDSIINQTFNDIEIICVDDCSTDNSLQILNDYANKDSRIKVIRLDKNRRQGGARNAGLDVATGKYITFIDSDDYVDSNYCEILYNNMIENDVDLVIANLTNYTLSDNDKLIELKKNFAKYDRKSEWPSGILNFSLNDDLSIISRPVAKLYRADIINQAQIRFPENSIQEDEAFYWYYMSFVNKLFVLHQSIYNRLLHEESTMFKKIYKNQNLEDFLKILKEIYKFLKKNKLFNKYKKRYKDYFNVVTRSILNNEYLSKKDKKRINSYIRKLEIECRIKSPFSYIFSATNLPSKEGRWYKVVNILGLKFSFRNKKKEKKVKDEQDKPQKEKYYKFKNCPVEQRPEMLKEWYFNRTGETLDIDNPETYNEKIQWLKLYDSTPLKTRLADKYLVRDWVKEKIGEEYLIPLLGVWDKFDDIDFDKLPNQFVLKCNHGCGYNIVVKDKSKLDLKEAKNKINEWMKEDFAFKNGFELHYSAIPRKIIAEAYIKEVDTEAIDYKFICCDGIPYLCWVTNKHLEIHERSFYKLPEWELQNIELKDGGAILDKVGVPKPENLSTMLEICKTLAKDFPFVRVDLYLVQDKILFGEMTFTSASGAALLYPDKWNYILGDKITLPNKKEENV